MAAPPNSTGRLEDHTAHNALRTRHSSQSAVAKVEVVGQVCILRLMRFALFAAPGAGTRSDGENPSTGDITRDGPLKPVLL
jgi:hypothetical protein